VYICAECIELCQSIIGQERRRRSPPRQPVAPTILRQKLDQFVSGQEEAKQTLVRAADGRNQGNGCVLLIGPSSSTKILLARALAHALEAPFAAGNWQGLSNTELGPAEGSRLLLSLLEASDFDIEAAHRGVVFIEGAEHPEAQDALLRLWRDNICFPVKGIQLAVQGILFVCGASFVGLEEAIAHLGRHPEQPVRFEDLKAIGVQTNWLSRLAGIARVTRLDENNLVRLVQWVDFRPCQSAANDGRVTEP
jgi:ATP-dependent Clp protease ATP-binding subunit ClpX